MGGIKLKLSPVSVAFNVTLLINIIYTAASFAYGFIDNVHE